MEKNSTIGMGHQVVAAYFKINLTDITKLAIRFAKKAVKEQDICGASVLTDTIIGGDEKYRITFCGAYNDLQDGGMKKTDYCFVKISFEVKLSNGRFDPIGNIWVKEHGISSATYADKIYDAIMDFFADNLMVKASYNDEAKKVVDTFEAIYNYCEEYGENKMYAEAEWRDYADVTEWEDNFQISMGDEPYDFYEEFGDDAEWNSDAEYRGMEKALQELSGKKYTIRCDGYRIIASVDGAEGCSNYSNELNNHMDWSYVKLF